MRRILIASSEKDLQCRFRRILSEANYQVYIAELSTEALELIASKSPDLVLVDISLQDSSGLRLARKIKNNPVFASTPIVLLTPAQPVGPSTHFFNDFFEYDIAPRELLDRVRKYVDKPEHSTGVT